PAVITRAAIEDEAALQTPVSSGRDGAARFVARVDPRSRIAENSEIELDVDTTRLYFFDPVTREAV
ncbi:MAG TPA: hypothetical protein VFR32_04445, partial [Gaiellaceae bacterium]|nr:hypothetical protein [Gaiellaceae bacterium]